VTQGRPQRPRRSGPGAPEIPEDITADELDPDVRRELASLGAAADTVARHLVAAADALGEDADLAYAHALAARHRAGRIGAVREACGIAAYHAGRFGEALTELRAARRLTGSHLLLPVMADCERGLGRPDRALALAADPAVRGLDRAARAEMLIVASGARRDLGQPDAAAVLLQVPDLRADPPRPWTLRLQYAYAAALLDAGRRDEARRWFASAARLDEDGETDAADRSAALASPQP
jgi:tetratricopeptide (TPR) repeat protein